MDVMEGGGGNTLVCHCLLPCRLNVMGGQSTLLCHACWHGLVSTWCGGVVEVWRYDEGEKGEVE
jgi:hypothetical protein